MLKTCEWGRSVTFSLSLELESQLRLAGLELCVLRWQGQTCPDLGILSLEPLCPAAAPVDCDQLRQEVCSSCSCHSTGFYKTLGNALCLDKAL